MPKYRLFEKNPITNEWMDRDWAEGSGQQDALRGVAAPGSEYFVVPESSFHPVKIAQVQVVRWEYTENGTETEEGD